MSATVEDKRREGALACMDVLRNSWAVIGEITRADESTEDYFRVKDATFRAIMAAAGSLSPQAAGVLGALADIAIDSLQNGYALPEQLDSDWRPEAVMTANEVEAVRREFADQVLAGRRAESNVINFQPRA